MKWQRQVLHVAGKDVRQGRWMIALYVLVVAAATATAAQSPVAMNATAFAWPLLVIALSMLLFAVFVQADSPAIIDAFWVTRPLQPSAVFAAKLLLALVVLVGVPLIGQLVALLAQDVATAEIPAQMARAALFLAVWVMSSGVLAAVTRDLRTFLLVEVLLLVFLSAGVTLIQVLITGDAVVTEGSPGTLLRFVSIAAPPAVLAHQYLTRDVRRGIALVALLVVVNVALSFRSGSFSATPPPAAGPVRAELRSARLYVQAARIAADDGAPAVQLDIALDGVAEAHQYRLRSPAIRIHGPGTTPLAPASNDIVLLNNARPVTAGVQWPGVTSLRQLARISFHLSAAQAAALARGNGALTLEGDIEIREARQLVRLPVERGAAVARRGNRFRITDVRLSGGRPSLTLRHSAVSTTDIDWREDYEYGLVNEDRSEVLALRPIGTSVTESALVVPTAGSMSSSLTLAVQERPGAALVSVGRSWLDRAQLVIVDWVSVGGYAVRAEAVAGR